MPTDSSAAVAADPMLALADAMDLAVETARGGPGWVRIEFDRVLPATVHWVSSMVYGASYAVSFGIVLPAVLIAAAVPRRNAAVLGLIDGAARHATPCMTVKVRLATVKLTREPPESPTSMLSGLPPRGLTVVASTAALGWDGVHGVLLEGRSEGMFDLPDGCATVLFLRKGASRLDWRRGSRFTRLPLKPGDVLVAPPEECNRVRFAQPVAFLVCPIAIERLAGIARREWPTPAADLRIVEGLDRKDEELWDLGARLAARMLDPAPGAHSAAVALQALIAVHLLTNYSTLGRPEETEGASDPRLGRVIDYMRRNLGDDVSLETLAGLAGLSPNYFLSAFRQATGLTPHRYVTELRVARARELLLDPHRSIAEVSLAVGFASQSHLTEVFRRTLATTPAAYRREALGLARNGDGQDSVEVSAQR